MLDDELELMICNVIVPGMVYSRQGQTMLVCPMHCMQRQRISGCRMPACLRQNRSNAATRAMESDAAHQ
jgi:hypothetical protein